LEVVTLVWGDGKRVIGRKLIELDDGRAMLCGIDEFGNIIPNTCEEIVEKTSGTTREFSFPGTPKVVKKK